MLAVGKEKDAGSSKGGLTKSPLRNLSIGLSVRKYCRVSCPVYPCVYAPMCRMDENGKKLGRKEALCAINQMDPKVRLRLARVLLNGERGIIDEMKGILIRAGMIVNGSNLGELKEYFEMLAKFKKEVYGGKEMVVEHQVVNIINMKWGSEKIKEPVEVVVDV